MELQPAIPQEPLLVPGFYQVLLDTLTIKRHLYSMIFNHFQMHIIIQHAWYTNLDSHMNRLLATWSHDQSILLGYACPSCHEHVTRLAELQERIVITHQDIMRAMVRYGDQQNAIEQGPRVPPISIRNNRSCRHM